MNFSEKCLLSPVLPNSGPPCEGNPIETDALPPKHPVMCLPRWVKKRT